MQSRVRILGHPVHPAVVRFPLVVFPLLVALDVLWAWTGSAGLWEATGWIGMAGAGAGILAILTGTVDLAAIPAGGRPQRLAAWHVAGALAVQSLYIFSVWARWPAGSGPHDAALAIGLDVAGFALVIVQGWLGVELRNRHHVGVPTVEEGAEPATLRQ